MPAILAHELPGRLRFLLPPLRRDAHRAVALRNQIAAVAGVTEVSANAVTGSVLIRHDGCADTRQRIIGGIEHAGYRLVADRPVRGLTVHPSAQPMAATVEPVIQAVVEKLLERMLHRALSAMI